MSLSRLSYGDTTNRDYTPGVAKDAGAIILLAIGLAAIVATDLSAGQLGAMRIDGVHDVNAASATLFEDGEDVWWDDSEGLAVKGGSATAAADFRIGTAHGAKIDGQTSMKVDLNKRPARAQRTISGAATLGISDLDSTILGDTQGGAFSITLMPAAQAKGRRLTFIRAGSGTNALTIDADGTELINGAQTHATMDALYDTITIESIGGAWRVVSSLLA